MPFLGYLFAPQNEIPSEGDREWHGKACSWIRSVDTAWEKRIAALPPNERPPAPAYRNLSTNMADMFPSACREWAAATEEATGKLLEKWKTTGGKLPDTDAALFEEMTGIRSKISTAYSVGYRGGFKPIPPAKLKRGAALGFLKVDSNPYEFKFGESDSIEVNFLLEIARSYGGDALALWSWGRSIGLLLARSASPGTRPRVYGPLYIAGGQRSTEHATRILDDLRAAFEGSTMKPDWKAIEAQLATPELSATAWCTAFGLPQVPEAAPTDAAEVLAAWERAAEALLTGAKPTPADAKTVNAALQNTGRDLKLPSKPAKGDGQSAYTIGGIQIELGSAIGWPKGSLWEQRVAAAELYSRIVDGVAGEWLTVGTDSKNFGASASLGRLLQLYPAEIRRDRLWAMQALYEAEAWNGHAFVSPLAALAEGTGIRLVLVVYPGKLAEAFRKEFGIERGDGAPAGAWEAEAFIETAGWPKKKPSEAAAAWIAKRKADAVMFLCDETAPQSRVWKSGMETGDDPKIIGLGSAPSAEAIRSASRELSPSAILKALGCGTVLHPPALEPEKEVSSGKNRAQAVQALAVEVPVIGVVTAPGRLAEVFVQRVQGSGHQAKRLVCLEVRGLSDLGAFARDLGGYLGKYTEIWQEEGCVRACRDSSVEWELIAGLLGDLPRGGSVKIVNSDGAGFCVAQG